MVWLVVDSSVEFIFSRGILEGIKKDDIARKGEDINRLV